MGDLNVPQREAEAIAAIDLGALGRVIDECIAREQAAAIWPLRLYECGPYIGEKLRSFERALSNHAKAKAARKRAETEYDVRKAGRDLEHAVRQMKARVETENKEGQLFFVDDLIAPPTFINERLNIRVTYRWRETIDLAWQYGSVTFFHDVVFQPDYLAPRPQRKVSPAEQRRHREEELFRQWEYFKGLALQAVRDHFRRGGAGAEIPEKVQSKPDPHTHRLNNFSAQF